MPRLLRRAPILAGAALALLVAIPVAADTTGGPENVDYAWASDASGMYTAQMSHDLLTGEYHLTGNVQTVSVIDCGGWEGELDVSISGSGVPATFAFGKQLSSASATGTIPAVRDSWNSCTGEQTEEAATMTVAISLTGSRYTSTSTTKTVIKNPDGTTTTYTGKFTQAIATGSFTIDGVKIIPSDARIEHDEMTVKTK